ncbi:hypothetical protein [Lysinibacillus xylanilyticus]|uniref:hypothetical protein n=1 Tax=Lysinibacillus xylanilyticus TaxID=582475 RepID=UPI0036DBDA27
MSNPVISVRGEPIEVRKIFNCLFEHETKKELKELIHVWYEDFDGYIVYEECTDCLQQKRKMTHVELFRDYKRVWE